MMGESSMASNAGPISEITTRYSCTSIYISSKGRPRTISNTSTTESETDSTT